MLAPGISVQPIYRHFSDLPDPKTLIRLERGDPDFHTVGMEANSYRAEWNGVRLNPDDATRFPKCVQALMDYNKAYTAVMSKKASAPPPVSAPVSASAKLVFVPSPSPAPIGPGPAPQALPKVVVVAQPVRVEPAPKPDLRHVNYRAMGVLPSAHPEASERAKAKADAQKVITALNKPGADLNARLMIADALLWGLVVGEVGVHVNTAKTLRAQVEAGDFFNPLLHRLDFFIERVTGIFYGDVTQVCKAFRMLQRSLLLKNDAGIAKALDENKKRILEAWIALNKDGKLTLGDHLAYIAQFDMSLKGDPFVDGVPDSAIPKITPELAAKSPTLKRLYDAYRLVHAPKPTPVLAVVPPMGIYPSPSGGDSPSSASSSSSKGSSSAPPSPPNHSSGSTRPSSPPSPHALGPRAASGQEQAPSGPAPSSAKPQPTPAPTPYVLTAPHPAPGPLPSAPPMSSLVDFSEMEKLNPAQVIATVAPVRSMTQSMNYPLNKGEPKILLTIVGEFIDEIDDPKLLPDQRLIIRFGKTSIKYPKITLGHTVFPPSQLFSGFGHLLEQAYLKWGLKKDEKGWYSPFFEK